MKKVLFLVMFAVVTTGAFSQIKAGFKGGVNYNLPSYKMNTDSLNKPKGSGLGYSFGGFVEAPMGDGLRFQGEVLFTFRTYNTKYVESSNESGIEYKLEEYGYVNPLYLEIPLLFKYNMEMNTGKYGSDNFLGIYAGPQFSLNFSDSYSLEKTISTKVFDQKTVVKEITNDNDIHYKPFDLGFVIGLVHDWEEGLRIGLRYSRSLGAINTNEEYFITHSALQLSIGYNLIKD